MWVVLVSFVKFGKACSVAWCTGDTNGTRQSLCSGGAGYHYVEVHGGVSGVKRDVGSVERCVFVDMVGVARVLYDDLFDEWFLSSHAQDDVGESVS